MNVHTYCKIFDIPEPMEEYKFDSKRRWRIDLAWPEKKLAVEIEGGAWIQGRHNRGGGFIKDMEKYNALTLAGYSLLRFTPQQMASGIGFKIIKEFLVK